MKRKYKHLIFDLDRTLWDFESNSREALNQIYIGFNLRDKGIPEFDLFETKYKTINEKCWADYREGKLEKEVLRTLRFELTLEAFGLNDPETALKMCDEYIYKSPRIPHVIDGAHEILTFLKKNYHLHILTNGFVEVQGIKMEKSNLKPYFEKVIITENAGAKKPHPQAFLYTLNKINALADECLMIGDDRISDIEGANNIGMDTVYFNPYKAEDSDLATYTIKHLSELNLIL